MEGHRPPSFRFIFSFPHVHVAGCTLLFEDRIFVLCGDVRQHRPQVCSVPRSTLPRVLSHHKLLGVVHMPKEKERGMRTGRRERGCKCGAIQRKGRTAERDRGTGRGRQYVSTQYKRKDGRSRIFFFLVSFKKFAWATVLSQAPAYFIRGLDPKAAHIPARWSCAVRSALCNHQGCCPGCSLSMKERTKVH